MKRITVYCGSSSGTEALFEKQARALGRSLAEKNIELVYGGARIGLMGAVADGVLEHKGRVIGVLPGFLKAREVAHESLSALILVDTMHERKMKMYDLSEGIIALPGGYGTLEELFEMLTWAQLGLHKKPIGILNINGFYNDLLGLLENMTAKGFLKQSNRDMLLVSDSIEDLLLQMKTYKAPETEQIIDRETT